MTSWGSSTIRNYIKQVLDKYQSKMKKEVQYSGLISNLNYFIFFDNKQLRSKINQVFQPDVQDKIYELLMKAQQMVDEQTLIAIKGSLKPIQNIENEEKYSELNQSELDDNDNDDDDSKNIKDIIGQQKIEVQSQKQNKKRQRPVDLLKSLNQQYPDQVRKQIKISNSNGKKIIPPFKPNAFVPQPHKVPNTGLKLSRRKQNSRFKVSNSQKKNRLYIKNMPPYYNNPEALIIFFKKYGSIREISCQIDKNLATIVFQKEIDAINASKNQQKVFGKSSIFKTLKIDEQPPEVMIFKNQMNEDKKNQRNQKQYLMSLYADKLRAILFFIHKFKGDQTELTSDFLKLKAEKLELQALSELSNQFKEKMKNLDYDPTIYMNKTRPQHGEKSYLSNRFEKFGKCIILNEHGGKQVKVKYFSLESVVKVIKYESENQPILSFNNLKMYSYIEEIINSTIN